MRFLWLALVAIPLTAHALTLTEFQEKMRKHVASLSSLSLIHI